jgi:hypothetical protein
VRSRFLDGHLRDAAAVLGDLPALCSFALRDSAEQAGIEVCNESDCPGCGNCSLAAGPIPRSALMNV